VTLGDYFVVEGLLGLLALGALVVWLLRPRGGARRTQDDIDHAELEAAEREVRDLDARHDPSIGPAGGEDDEDDWGPGATPYRR
jgi:hypothetical protein